MTDHSNLQVDNSIQDDEQPGWLTGTEILNLKEDGTSRFLWEPFIPKVGMVALAGPSDCGKSTLVRQLAISVATKQETFLGSPLNVNHGRVCYIATEDEQYGTRPVLEKQLNGFGLDKADNLYFKFDSVNFLKDTAEFLSKFKVDLIVIDPWMDIFKGNPNDASAVRNEINPWYSLAKQHECCILLLHHNVKNSEKTGPDKNKLNGSQALEAKLRFILELRMGQEQNPDERHLTIIKGNYLPPEMKNKPSVLKLDSDSLLFTATGLFAGAADATKKRGYDRELWLGRFKEATKNGESIKSAVGILEKEFPDMDVPSVTWFKENRKGIVGHSDNKENDRPTFPDSMNSLLDPAMGEGLFPG